MKIINIMSWGRKSKCEVCKTEINDSEKCKEYNYCLKHRECVINLDHMKKCHSCMRFLSNYPECECCHNNTPKDDLNCPSNCKQHKYCIDCLNGKTKTKYYGYANQTVNILDHIGCDSCLKFFRSLLKKTPTPPNCFLCGMFATCSELCEKHQYCKECKAYLLEAKFNKIERIKNCKKCFQELSPEYREQQAIKKAHEENLKINKVIGINATNHMDIDRNSKNHCEEKKTMEGINHNFQNHRNYFGHGDINQGNNSYQIQFEHDESKSASYQLPFENKGGNINTYGYNFDDHFKASPNPNEMGGFIDKKNHWHDSPNQKKVNEHISDKNDFREPPDPFNYDDRENSKFLYQNVAYWPSDSEKDAQNISIPNKRDIYEDFIDPSVILEEIENKRIADSIVSTSQEDYINKNYIGASVMHEGMQIDRIENYGASDSKNENPTQILNANYEKNLPRTDIHENPLGPHHFNDLPDLLSICANCNKNQGVILSVCGHAFCKFCFFFYVQYQPIFTFINSISSNSPIAEIFTYKCTCSSPFISYLPALHQLDFIQHIYKEHSEATMGKYYQNFSIIAPSDYILRYYSFYLDGLPCKFESCKTCNSKQYASELEPYCLWCKESFHT